MIHHLQWPRPQPVRRHSSAHGRQVRPARNPVEQPPIDVAPKPAWFPTLFGDAAVADEREAARQRPWAVVETPPARVRRRLRQLDKIVLDKGVTDADFRRTYTTLRGLCAVDPD